MLKSSLKYHLRCAEKIVSQLEKGEDRDNNNSQVSVRVREDISCQSGIGRITYQDSYTMAHNDQDQDKLSWTPTAKTSNVKQSKSVTFKDC